jgi:hypothetical protein
MKLHLAVFFNLLLFHLFNQHIPLSTLFSNTLSLCSCLDVRDPSFTPIQNHRQNYIVMDLTNAVPDNSSVDMNRGNNRREIVFG